MHGSCFYLAKENCQDMEMIDWDEVEVQEERNKTSDDTQSEGGVTSEGGGGGGAGDASSVREEPDGMQASFFQ